MKYLTTVMIMVLLAGTGCRKETSLPARRVEGEISGLKKGSLRLGVLRNGKPRFIDSIEIKGEGKFLFDLKTIPPQMMILQLREKPSDYALFFAGDSVTQVYTSLQKFGTDIRVKGDTNTRLWVDYYRMIRRFNDKELELIRDKWEASRSKDTAAAHKLEKELTGLQKRRKLYALNFALTHADLPVGAYAAYTEFYANPVILDTVYKSLSPAVKKSYYGKEIARQVDSLQSMQSSANSDEQPISQS